MEDAVGDSYLSRLPKRSMNSIYGYISSCCSILNSPEWLDIIKQANNLASVLGGIESDRLGTKRDINKRQM